VAIALRRAVARVSDFFPYVGLAVEASSPDKARQKDESRRRRQPSSIRIYQVLLHSSQAKIKKIKHSRIGEQMQTWLTSNKTHHILSNCHPPTYYHNYSYQFLSGWLTLANTGWGMKIKMLLQRKNL